MEITLRTQLETLLTRATNPTDRATQLSNLKAGKPLAVQNEIDAFANAFVDCYHEGGVGKTSAECLDEIRYGKDIENGVALLREYAKKNRPEEKLPADLFQRELDKFEAYYRMIRPRVPESDLAEFDAEYQAIHDYRFKEGKPISPFLDAYYALGVGSLNLALGLYNRLPADDVRWNLILPLWPLYGFRLWSYPHAHLTPVEQKSLSRWLGAADVITTLASQMPAGKSTPPADPQAAGETSYHTSGPLAGTDNALDRYLFNNASALFMADARAGLSLRRLDDVRSNYVGPPLATTIASTLVDSGKLILASHDRETVHDKMNHSLARARGEPGEACSAADAEEIELFRLQHPERANLDDAQIREILCSAHPEGSNEALTAPKRAEDIAIEGRLKALYLNTALHRNFRLVDTHSGIGLITAGGLALAQPFLNQGAIGHDFVLEAVAGLETAASYNHPDLLLGLGMANDQMAGALFYPEFYRRVEPHASRDYIDKTKNIPGTLYNLALVLDLGNQYGTGVEHGEKLRLALGKHGIERLQYMSPLAAGLIAHGIRLYRSYDTSETPDIEGLSSSEVEDLQAPYKSDTAHWMHWAALGSYAVGTTVGALTAGGSASSAISFGGEGGLLGGRVLATRWRLNPGPLGVVLSGEMLP